MSYREQTRGIMGMHGRGEKIPAHRFLFATGIENSYPTITGKNGESIRRDELESTGFYQHWREDLELLRDLKVEYLRYGPQYYRAHLGDGRYDWEFTDLSFGRLKEIGVVPIADLCHFGLPDWIGSYQNPDWPDLFASFARAFAQRYPWVRLITPVNEIFVNATFSAQRGWWNDRLKDDRSFVTALKHMCKANLRAEEEILQVQPNAIFIQSEATACYHERTREAGRRASIENEKRFLSFDLSYGHHVNSDMYEYLFDNGMSRQEYHWFLEHGDGMRPHCVMGSDYYGGNEHWVAVEGPMKSAGPVLGYAVLARQYFDRYHLPLMLTETNTMDPQTAPDWLHHQWACIRELRRIAIPVMGFTWYSLLDQVDWDVALREVNGKENPVGLYDLNRQPHPIRNAYRDLIAEWRDQMPMDVQYG
jgi:beta-glucosidase